MIRRPSSINGKGKKCVVSGCNEVRVTAVYCVKHQNVSVGSEPKGAPTGSLESCLAQLIESLATSKRSSYVGILSAIAKDISDGTTEERADRIFSFSGLDASTLPANKEDGTGGVPGALGGLDPIVDIKVTIGKSVPEKVPDGYTVLRRTISGGHSADLNRGGGGKSVYLLYKRAPAVERDKLVFGTGGVASWRRRAVTALCVYEGDEEAPYGFKQLDTTLDNQPADLNAGTRRDERGLLRPISLAVAKGEGAPLIDIAVVCRERKEEVSDGVHEVKRTPFGNKADLSAGNDVTLLAALHDVRPVVRLFADLLPVNAYYARLTACLAACLYSYDQRLVTSALDCYRRLPLESVPAAVASTFLSAVCDAAPVLLTYFTSDGLLVLARFLAEVAERQLPSLRVETLLKMVETCFLVRHEDKQAEASQRIVDMIMAGVQEQMRQETCTCRQDSTIRKAQKAAPPDTTLCVRCGQALSRASSPASPSSPPMSPMSEMGSPRASNHELASPLAHRGSLPDAAPLPSSPPPAVPGGGRGRRHDRLVSVFDGREIAPMVQEGEEESSSAFCFTFLQRIIDHVALNKEIEIDVGKIQRHSVSTDSPEFRADVALLADALHNYDRGGVEVLAMYRRRFVVVKEAKKSYVPTDDDEEQDKAKDKVSKEEEESGENLPERKAHLVRLLELDKRRRGDFTGKDQRALIGITLMCCRFTAEPAVFNARKSETVKRKVHALSLLLYMLKKTLAFWRRSVGTVLVLRRFVCPALVLAGVTDAPAVFRLLLQTFVLLFENFKDQLYFEIGGLLDQLFLAMLDSPHCTVEQKKDIIDVFLHIFRPTEALPEMFYNYDNHGTRPWFLFEKLVSSISKLTEGEVRKGGIGSAVSAPVAVTESKSGEATTGDATATESSAGTQSPEEQLQLQGLKLLVYCQWIMARWVGVPSMRKTSPSDKSAEESLAVLLSQRPAPAPEDAPSPRSANDSPAVGQVGTWMHRHSQRKADQKVQQHALTLAKTEKLKSAIKYLRMMNPALVTPPEIAKFLFNNEGLDRSDVGDFLGDLDGHLSEEEHQEVRNAYLALLDFTAMTPDLALRSFLCDSGFRLPGEAQKISRLLESLAAQYCRDNPDVFRSSASAFIVFFAMVMLNTDLHDPRLKTGASRRTPMTCDQFVANLREQDEGFDFPREMLVGLYNGIKAAPVEWQDRPSSVHVSAPGDGSEENGLEEKERRVRKFLELISRRTLALIKRRAPLQQSYHAQPAASIVLAMFEVSWFSFVAAISARIEASQDVDVVHYCLDGLAYGAAIALTLDMKMECDAFARVLAKITFLEAAKRGGGPPMQPQDLARKLIVGQHLKQDWYQTFQELHKQSPRTLEDACKLLLQTAHDTKSRISYERHQIVLRQLQQDFGGDLNLVEPGRSFVRSGRLAKVTASRGNGTERVEYVFFLFNDLFLYASEGMQTKYKMHRLVHLALCRLVDIKSTAIGFAFRVVSPQKTFVVCAPSLKVKQQWLEALHTTLREARPLRRKFIQAGKGTEESNHAPVDRKTKPDSRSSTGDIGAGGEEHWEEWPGDNEMNHTSSTMDLYATQHSGKDRPYCRLCTRNYALFRRKMECPNCNEEICTDCCQHKAVVRGSKSIGVPRRVCDACFGVIQGMVADDAALLVSSDT